MVTRTAQQDIDAVVRHIRRQYPCLTTKAAHFALLHFAATEALRDLDDVDEIAFEASGFISNYLPAFVASHGIK